MRLCGTLVRISAFAKVACDLKFELVPYFLVDVMGFTAGDIALSLNNEPIYRTIRDAGIRSEFLLRVLQKKSADPENPILQSEDSTAAGSTAKFLATKLRYETLKDGQEVCLAKVGEEEEVGVMMGWERPISE